MRRAEFTVEAEADLIALLADVGHGTLGFAGPEGWPAVRPVNFVHVDGRIYFHGSLEGEKMDGLRADDRVSFVAVKEFAVIPSHFVHKRNACPATQYFDAVMIRGRARIVADADEKARALQALMEKLQPEGGHVPITAQDPLYTQSIESTGVVAIEIEHMSGKRKVGQNVPPAKRARVEAGLEKRGCPIDHATLEAMRANAPAD